MEQFATNAQSTLSAAISTTGATTLTIVTPVAGQGFPGSGTFRIRIDNEIMTVTGVSGTTFTVTRGQEGTTAATHSSGAAVTAVITAAALAQWQADILASVALTTSTVVGPSSTINVAALPAYPTATDLSGMTIALPSAGVYLMYARVLMQFSDTHSFSTLMHINMTDGTTVFGNSEFYTEAFPQAQQSFEYKIFEKYTAAGAANVKLQIIQNSTTTATINANGCLLMWIKIG